MHPTLRLVPVVAIIAALGALPAHAQKKRAAGTKPDAAALDSVRLAYALQPGATVSYRVVMHDTIALASGNVFRLAAERSFIVTYRCDSLVRDGIAMTMIYDTYAAREWRDTLPAITRTGNPWTDRSYSFLMLPDGRRTRSLSPADTPRVAPAGPFQPLVLPFLGEESTHVGASGIFDLQHWLIDNVTPPIMYRASSFRTVVGRRDTMGVPTIELLFSETGQATYEAPGGIATRGVVSSEARHWFAPSLNLPIAGRTESLLNLTVTNRNGGEAVGRQTILLEYELVIRDEAMGGADDASGASDEEATR